MPGHRFGLSLLLTGLMLAGTPGIAPAQGIFDLLFGGLRRLTPPAARAYVDPGSIPDGTEEDHPTAAGGPVSAYCVRTCDGGFFPVQRTDGATAGELCRSLCPSASTKVYTGAGIAHAVASDGARYADLPAAYRYRDTLVAGCSCNAGAPGLKRIDAAADPTLRPGDLVATGKGLMAYRGARHGSAEFTPVKPSAIAADRKLSSIRIQQR